MNRFHSILTSPVWLAIALQILILGSLVFINERTIATGTEVVLQVVPVDPRDPFYGDYETINYEISRLSASLVVGDIDNLHSYDPVYVQLGYAGDVWEAVAISADKPDAGIFIRGTLSSLPDEIEPDTQLRITYDIEQYYIPEGTGGQLRPSVDGYTARVVVDKQGNPVLRGIDYLGKPITFTHR